MFQREIVAIVSKFGEIKQNEHFLGTIEECVVSHIWRRSHVTLLSSPATAASLGLFTLDHTATRCNTLQHTATHCNTLQHTAPHHTAQKHTENIFNLNKNSTLPLWLPLSVWSDVWHDTSAVWHVSPPPSIDVWEIHSTLSLSLPVACSFFTLLEETHPFTHAHEHKHTLSRFLSISLSLSHTHTRTIHTYTHTHTHNLFFTLPHTKH